MRIEFRPMTAIEETTFQGADEGSLIADCLLGNEDAIVILGDLAVNVILGETESLFNGTAAKCRDAAESVPACKCVKGLENLGFRRIV